LVYQNKVFIHLSRLSWHLQTVFWSTCKDFLGIFRLCFDTLSSLSWNVMTVFWSTYQDFLGMPRQLWSSLKTFFVCRGLVLIHSQDFLNISKLIFESLMRLSQHVMTYFWFTVKTFFQIVTEFWSTVETFLACYDWVLIHLSRLSWHVMAVFWSTSQDFLGLSRLSF
jgi:hypothetical protein